QANALFEQALYQRTIVHRSQPSLFQVVTNCEKRPIGTQGGFGYKSQYEDYDIALMESMILAHWACAEAKEPKKQKIRYKGGDLVKYRKKPVVIEAIQ